MKDYRLKLTTAQLNAHAELIERFRGHGPTIQPWSAFDAPRDAYVLVPESDRRADTLGGWYGETTADRPGYIFIGIEPDGYTHS